MEAHEIMHTMGGVQPSAPHGTADGQCTVGSDPMCDADRPTTLRHSDAGVDGVLLACCKDDDAHFQPPPAARDLAGPDDA